MRKTKGISFRRILSHERCEWFRVIRMHTKAETNININACTRGGCHECGWYDTVKPNEGIGEYLKCISPRSPECARRKAGGWYRGNSRCPAGERIPRVFSNSCMRVRVSSRETHICFRCVINWTYFRSVASVTINYSPHIICGGTCFDDFGSVAARGGILLVRSENLLPDSRIPRVPSDTVFHGDEGSVCNENTG